MVMSPGCHPDGPGSIPVGWEYEIEYWLYKNRKLDFKNEVFMIDGLSWFLSWFMDGYFF